MSYVRPVFVSERETTHLWVDERTMDDAKWEDCGPCTALMACNAHAPGTAPATHYEEESLRQEAGYGALGGTDVPQLCAGIAKRYGIAVAQVGSLAAFLAAMTPGNVAFAIVQPSKLPLNHFLRQNVGTAFVALHFVYLAREDANRFWVIDPAAPANTGYDGQWISEADVRTCYVGGAGILDLATEQGADAVSVYESTAATGSFAVSAGATCHAYKITAAGFVRTGAQIDTGTGRYDAALRRISGAAVPSSLLHVASGLFASFYVDTAEIDAKPDAPSQTYTKAQLDAAAAAAHDAGYAQAKAKAVSATSAI